MIGIHAANPLPRLLTGHTLVSYSIIMRTTIYLDDHLGERLKRAAADKGMSLSAFLAESGRVALGVPVVASEPFRLVTYGAGGVYPGIDLDRAGELLAGEDADRYGGKG